MVLRGFELHTARLILREILASDGPSLYAIDTSPHNNRYDPDPGRSLPEFQDIAAWLMNTRDETPRKFYYMAALLPDPPYPMIGGVHITLHSREHRQAEIGYSFRSDVWGQGYATEAAREMRDFAFATLNMHRVFAADIIAENTASVRIAQKLGMRLEATMQDTYYFQERWWASCTYAMTISEWHATQPDPTAGQPVYPDGEGRIY